MKFSLFHLLTLASLAAAASKNPEPITEDDYIKQIKQYDTALTTEVQPRINDFNETLAVGNKWLAYDKKPEGMTITRIEKQLYNDVLKLWGMSKLQDPTWDVMINDDNSSSLNNTVSEIRKEGEKAAGHGYKRAAKLAETVAQKYEHAYHQYHILTGKLADLSRDLGELNPGGPGAPYKRFTKPAIKRKCESAIWTMARILMDTYAASPALATIKSKVQVAGKGVTGRPEYWTNTEWNSWYQKEVISAQLPWKGKTGRERVDWDCAKNAQVTPSSIRVAVSSTFSIANLLLFDTLFGTAVLFEDVLAAENEAAKKSLSHEWRDVWPDAVQRPAILTVYNKNETLIHDLTSNWIGALQVAWRPTFRTGIPVHELERLYSTIKNPSGKEGNMISDMLKFAFDGFGNELAENTPWTQLRGIFKKVVDHGTQPYTDTAYAIKGKTRGTMGKVKVGAKFQNGSK